MTRSFFKTFAAAVLLAALMFSGCTPAAKPTDANVSQSVENTAAITSFGTENSSADDAHGETTTAQSETSDGSGTTGQAEKTSESETTGADVSSTSAAFPRLTVNPAILTLPGAAARTTSVSAVGKTSAVNTSAATTKPVCTNKLNVIFTIDVEDKRGAEPNLIEGDLTSYGIAQNCGINYIMSTFEKYNARAVFFVNIYEASLYDEDYMPSLLRRIDSRGHEVGLHTHNPPDKSVAEYTKMISKMTQAEQEALFKYGRNYIYNAIGKYPVSYRSGAYHSNDTIFRALSNTGFLVDSSVYYGNANNLFNKYANLKNQTFEVDGLTEFPVIAVYNGKSWRKLDIDSLTWDELYDAFEMIRESGQYSTVQIMFHSFTFLDFTGTGGSPIVYEDDRLIYGENKDTKQKLNRLLSWMQSSEYYSIITFRDYLASDCHIPNYEDDNLIYLANKNLSFEKKHISVAFSGTSVTMTNSFGGDGNLSYAWDIVSESTGKYYAQSGYSHPTYTVDFGSAPNGNYFIKAYVKDSGDNRMSRQFYTVSVKGGKVVGVT